MADTPLVPIILSGGAGTRLWPMSRHLRPKQFLNVHGEGSMFGQTLKRISNNAYNPPVVVCNEEHRFLVAEELRQSGTTAEDIILEPIARNTAPALTVAALRLMDVHGDALILVLPSDQVVHDVDAFHSDVAKARALALEGYLIAFGVTPTKPETGYGYIKCGQALCENSWHVEMFVEKPDRETAQNYIDQGDYFWNAGIFLFKASTLIAELERLSPNVTAAARSALDGAGADLVFLRLASEAFAEAPAISFDYAVMEKTDHAAMVPLTSAWNDIGSWSSVWDLGETDQYGNVIYGDAVLLDVKNTLVHTDKSLVAALGVQGLAIIVADDTVLVLPKDRAQDVKELVNSLETKGHKETISHKKVFRPWGYYRNVDDGAGFLVKRIVVNPGAKLSLQHHNHRAEHWVVVEGIARVTNGNDVIDLFENQSIYIPVATVHRLENTTDRPLHLIEVQTGDVISEEDIVRHEDTYGRA
jgi:mannose-1-phosphate guanylyltransferase/mannose-6-phosphate isomerase